MAKQQSGKGKSSPKTTIKSVNIQGRASKTGPAGTKGAKTGGRPKK